MAAVQAVFSLAYHPFQFFYVFVTVFGCGDNLVLFSCFCRVCFHGSSFFVWIFWGELLDNEINGFFNGIQLVFFLSFWFIEALWWKADAVPVAAMDQVWAGLALFRVATALQAPAVSFGTAIIRIHKSFSFL
jgi:hypothetical protein